MRSTLLGLGGILTVSVAPSFAAKWPSRCRGSTASRLKNPEVDVRVSASMQITDFSRDDVDLAIRYGAGR